MINDLITGQLLLNVPLTFRYIRSKSADKCVSFLFSTGHSSTGAVQTAASKDSAVRFKRSYDFDFLTLNLS